MKIDDEYTLTGDTGFISSVFLNDMLEQACHSFILKGGHNLRNRKFDETNVSEELIKCLQNGDMHP